MKQKTIDKKMSLAKRYWEKQYFSNFYNRPWSRQREYADALWEFLKEEGFVSDS